MHAIGKYNICIYSLKKSRKYDKPFVMFARILDRSYYYKKTIGTILNLILAVKGVILIIIKFKHIST